MRGCIGLAAFLAVLALSGCLGDGRGGCAMLPTQAVVQAVSGSDVHVLLDDGQPAVLHLPAEVFVRDGGGCAMVGPAGVRVGDQLSFEVDAWAESYPMQGWPEAVVIVR